jgi:hypothetical protein
MSKKMLVGDPIFDRAVGPVALSVFGTPEGVPFRGCGVD